MYAGCVCVCVCGVRVFAWLQPNAAVGLAVLHSATTLRITAPLTIKEDAASVQDAMV